MSVPPYRCQSVRPAGPLIELYETAGMSPSAKRRFSRLRLS